MRNARLPTGHSVFVGAIAAATFSASPVHATGLATCDSGPQSGWQPQATLEKHLVSQSWQVRRIKIDGGCYEVYAINDRGERVEAYFHPVTLAPVPTSRSGSSTVPSTPATTTPPVMRR
jgi:hypothetical protein